MNMLYENQGNNSSSNTYQFICVFLHIRSVSLTLEMAIEPRGDKSREIYGYDFLLSLLFVRDYNFPLSTAVIFRQIVYNFYEVEIRLR